MKWNIEQIKKQISEKKDKDIPAYCPIKARNDALRAKEWLDGNNITLTSKSLLEAFIWLSARKNTDKSEGLFIYGNCGTGKTVTAKLISAYMDINFITATKIQQEHLKGKINGYDYGKTWKPMIIDDLGSEAKTHDFGAQYELLEYVITDRYEAYINSYGKAITVITTNLDGKQIIDRYGNRIYDRIHEMCKTFAVTGESLRQKTKEQ